MKVTTPFVLCAAICGCFIFVKSSHAQTSTPIDAPFGFSSDSPGKFDGNLPLINDDSIHPLYPCACGCGMFEVGTASMFPMGQGGMLWLEYDYQDQNINWSGVRPAPRSENSDKNIRTNFITLGLQYFFDPSWGIQVELPYENRNFHTVDASGADSVTQWGGFGDARVEGIYTGFSEDQSIGVTFGAKLPTGTYHHHGADRDTQIGTGSFDLLAGGFFRHNLGASITGFAQVLLDAPVDEFQGYRPGVEADAAIGAYYAGLRFGDIQVTPIAQVLMGERGHDSGPNSAHPLASGFQRLLLSPGLEVDLHPFSIYGDIEVPVWQHFSGDQLTAPFMVKVILTYHF